MLVVFFLLGTGVFPAEDEKYQVYYSAVDSLSISELTFDEMHFYRSEYFPLSLAEEGRQSVSSWRGMPPGYLDYSFRQVPLLHPLWGYWDNQLLPLEITRTEYWAAPTYRYQISPVRVYPSARPVSRVAYAQDMQFGLSYLDVGLSQYYRPGSYFRLGGNNFLRTGTAGNLTQIQVNTYRGQIHHQLSSRLSIDLWYWQLRHRFRLGQYPYFDLSRRVHRIGQVGWVSLKYSPDSSQVLILIPHGNKWGDRYRVEDYSEQRKTELYSLGLILMYKKTFEKGWWELRAEGIRHEITRAFLFREMSQRDGAARLNMGRRWKNLEVQLGGNYRHSQYVGGSPGLNFQLNWEPLRRVRAQIDLSREPQNLPLATLSWKGGNIKSISDPKVPIRQGASGSLSFPFLPGSSLSIGSFYHEFENAWVYSRNNSAFTQTNYWNSGVNSRIALNLWFFNLENELTYNYNYQNGFAPEINNILKLNLPIHLFKRALKLDGYALYHYIGKWRILEYEPLTNQYLQTNTPGGQHHLIDFKVLAHIKSATLFFVWKNVLSQDYALVEGYWNFFLTFRFGVYWTLFD
ncbi:MAG: hypothetical protein Kow0042_25810 [Calditrichia bacterium]